MRLALAIVVLCIACNGGELIYETVSDHEGGGRSEMTLDGTSVRLRSHRAGADRRSRGELTPDGLDALLSAREAVTRALADDVERCNIADTTSFIYHLEDAGGGFGFSHCNESEFVGPVATLVDVVREIVVGLRRCEDNATIDVQGACIPAS